MDGILDDTVGVLALGQEALAQKLISIMQNAQRRMWRVKRNEFSFTIVKLESYWLWQLLENQSEW